MTVWALADLHLSHGVADKKMDIFGEQWQDHANKIARNWRAAVAPSDLVLIPGDISWAMRPEEAIQDLLWIHELPGTKVILRGNHDYWWGSYGKVQKILPPSILAIQNNSISWNNISIGGTRLWDSVEYQFHEAIDALTPAQQQELGKEIQKDSEASEKVFRRELQRLEISLKMLDPSAKHRIAMTHYPPIGLDLKPSETSRLLEKYKVDICVFGHLHGVSKKRPLFGERHGICFVLASCDYLDFTPITLIKGF